MKIDFNQKIMLADGSGPVMKVSPRPPKCKNCGHEESEKADQPLTLRDVVVDALLLPESSTDGLERAKRGALAIVIARNSKDTQLDLSVEEIATIKECVGKTLGPLVVTQAWQMLEGKIMDTDSETDDHPKS